MTALLLLLLLRLCAYEMRWHLYGPQVSVLNPSSHVPHVASLPLTLAQTCKAHVSGQQKQHDYSYRQTWVSGQRLAPATQEQICQKLKQQSECTRVSP